MSKNYLKFWGTRGSCPVSGPEYAHFGGNTVCLELVYDEVHLIFDAGTGIRPLGQGLLKEGRTEIDLFLSHTHWDHLSGFPFFEPIYLADRRLTIWAPQGEGRSCQELFKELFAHEFFPLKLSELKATIQFQTIHEQQTIRKGPITLSFHKVNHPGGAYCFKIQTPHQTIGYISDNELLEPIQEKQASLIAFYKDCDLLIHEAQYFPEEYQDKKSWGHSGLNQATRFVAATGAKKWIISHHDPAHTDVDLKQLAKLAAEPILHQKGIPSEWVRDGQVIELK